MSVKVVVVVVVVVVVLVLLVTYSNFAILEKYIDVAFNTTDS